MSEQKLVYSDIKFTINKTRNRFVNQDIINFLRNSNKNSKHMTDQIKILFLNVNKSSKIGLTLVNENVNPLNEFLTLKEEPVYKGVYNEKYIDGNFIIKGVNEKRLEDNTNRQRRVFKIYDKIENKIFNIQSCGILPVFSYNNNNTFY